MGQVLLPAVIVQLDPESAPFWKSVTVNVSPAGTLAPKVRLADERLPGEAIVVTLHVFADVLTQAVESET